MKGCCLCDGLFVSDLGMARAWLFASVMVGVPGDVPFRESSLHHMESRTDQGGSVHKVRKHVFGGFFLSPREQIHT